MRTQRQDVQLQVGDRVLVKLQPFPIIAKIGMVEYKLQHLAEERIHPVFSRMPAETV